LFFEKLYHLRVIQDFNYLLSGINIEALSKK
jgi:hypothetical protein